MRKTSGWFIGTILVMLGLGLLLNAIGVPGFHDFIVAWWPLIFIVLGLGRLLEGNFTSGIFWLLIGLIIGSFTTSYIPYNGNIWQIIWPVIIILIGLRFLFRPAFHNHDWHGHNHHNHCWHGNCAGDSSSAIFSGTEKKITDKDFKGMSLDAVFGGAKLDLRDATIDKDGATIDVSAVFGGIEILVPKKTPVKINVHSVFGGHTDKRNSSEIDNILPAVTIRGEAIFGGIEVRD